MKSLRLIVALWCPLVLFVPASGHTQTYPAKTIKIVVPYPAGGPTDLVGRTVADGLNKALNKPVVVENKAGAGGTIGSDAVVKSPADGYTLLLGLMGPMSIAPKVSPNLAYDPLKDLAPIRLVSIMPEVLVARPQLGFRTLADAVAFGKANPGKLTIASAGSGTLPHLAAELLKRETGIDALHVPYRGAAPAAAGRLYRQRGHPSIVRGLPRRSAREMGRSGEGRRRKSGVIHARAQRPAFMWSTR